MMQCHLVCWKVALILQCLTFTHQYMTEAAPLPRKEEILASNDSEDDILPLQNFRSEHGVRSNKYSCYDFQKYLCYRNKQRTNGIYCEEKLGKKDIGYQQVRFY